MIEATTATVPRPRGDRRRLFLTPAVFITLLLTIAPLVFTLGMSFTNAHLSRQGGISLTWSNWSRLFTDGAFRQIVVNTLIYVVFGVTLQYVIGLGLALSLDMLVVKGRWLRVLMLVPMMMSPVAVGFIIGRMMLGPSGPVTQALSALGAEGVVFFTAPMTSKFSMVLVDTWQWTPLIVLILLAGLQTVPRSLRESAYVDGASEWQVIRHIILPLLGTASLAAIVLRTMEAFKIIEIIIATTGGGPGRATESLSMFVYYVGVNNGDIAYAAAAGFLMLLIVVVALSVLAGIGRRFTRVSL